MRIIGRNQGHETQRVYFSQFLLYWLQLGLRERVLCCKSDKLSPDSHKALVYRHQLDGELRERLPQRSNYVIYDVGVMTKSDAGTKQETYSIPSIVYPRVSSLLGGAFRFPCRLERSDGARPVAL